MLVSPTPFSFGKLSLSGGIDVASQATRLTEKYPNACSDFYGSGTPCVYKSGPDWPIHKGPLAQRIVREPRPVHGHAIQPTWVSIGTRICDELESVDIMWTSVNPLAYANAGEPKPFCPLIICVGVNPGSLLYEAAVAAAAVVKNISPTPASLTPRPAQAVHPHDSTGMCESQAGDPDGCIHSHGASTSSCVCVLPSTSQPITSSGMLGVLC